MRTIKSKDPKVRDYEVNGYFQANLFNGDKSRWKEFHDEVRFQVNKQCHDFGTEYLFPQDPWPLNDAGTPNLEETEYAKKVKPACYINSNRPDAEKKLRTDLRKAIEDDNRKIDNMTEKILDIITSRCSEDINQSLTNADTCNSNPILCWNHLVAEYGPARQGDQDIGNFLIKAINSYMLEDESFNNFFLRFDRIAEAARFDEGQKLGLILARSDDLDNKLLKISPLVSRLNEAVQKCRQENFTFPQTIKYLRDADERLRLSESVNKKIKVVKDNEEVSKPIYNPKCWNCCNLGHTAHTCLLEACGKCRRFDCGHNCLNCPKQSGEGERSNQGGRGGRTGRGRGSGRNGGGRGNRGGRGNLYNDNNDGDNRDYSGNQSKRKREFKTKQIKSTDGEEMLDNWWNEDDDVDSDLNFPVRVVKRDYNHDEENNKRVKISIIKSTKIRNIRKPLEDYDILYDSGAQQGLVPTSFKPRLQDIKSFSGKKSDVALFDAGNHPIDIVGEGALFDKSGNCIQDRMFISNDIDEGGGLLSGPCLRNKGYTVVIPSVQMSPDVGIIVHDNNGKVIMLGDTDLVIDSRDIGTYHHTITPAILDTVIINAYRVNAVYGFAPDNVAELVSYIQRCFHTTKDRTIWISTQISNFPVTPEQIKKYWKEDICWLKGNLKSRKIDVHQFDEVKTKKSRKNRKDSTKDLETRNLKIGWQIGLDFFGPVAGYAVLDAVDKASGFSTSSTHFKVSTKSSKKELFNEFTNAKAPELMQEIIHTYAKNGHHQKEFQKSINEARADSDKKFKSQDMKKLCSSNGIHMSFSPPNQHAWNGLVEQHHGVISNQITSLFACARWIPEALWPDAWNLAELLLNLHQSHLPDVDETKYESFLGSKPNWNSLGILPFGQPVMFQEIGDEGRFQDKAKLGAYVSPASNTVGGGIVVINWKTKRHIVTSTYRILKELPAQFVNLDPRHWESVSDQEGETTENEERKEEQEQPTAISTRLPTAPLLPAVRRSLIPKAVSVTPSTSSSIVPSNLIDNTSESPVINALIPIETATAPIVVEEIIIAPDSVVSDAQDPIAPDVSLQSSSLTPENNLSADNNVVRTTDSVNTDNARPKRNVGTYKDGPAKARTVKQHQIHNYHVPDIQFIKAVKKQKKKHGSDNPTLTQAMKRKDWPKFQEAIKEEYKQMLDDAVYGTKSMQYKDLPDGHNLLGSMFTLNVKRNPTTGEVDKYKARLVALGNQQDSSSYQDISSSTARGSSVKLLIALQAALRCESMVLDVKGAFLKSEIDESCDEKLYLKLPNGQIKKLHKYIYGLKQAGKRWQDNITNTLLAAGYRETVDPLVFTKRVGDRFIAMSVHVDDFYVISNNNDMLSTLYNELIIKYGNITKKSGDIIEYIGMSIKKLKNGDIMISQPTYVDKILESAGMTDCNHAPTPYVAEQTALEDDEEKVDKNTYLSYVGSLNYLACYTRPDILYALSRIAQQCSSPNKADMRRVMRVFRYVKGTRELGIVYKADVEVCMASNVDANFNSYRDGKSHYGYTIRIGRGKNGSIVSKSSKIRIVTLSSTESEYIALCHCCTEVIFLILLLEGLGFIQDIPTTIYEDNQSTINQVYGNMKHGNTKHINPKFHYTREQIRKGKVCVKYVKTEDNIADLLTKPLPTRQGQYLSSLILNSE